MTLKTMARQWLLPFIDPRRLASLVHLPAFLLEWRSFRRRAPDMKAGLAAPLRGMGTAFSASLFGLAGSLVLGFLELQVGQAQNRFFNDLEEIDADAVNGWTYDAATMTLSFVGAACQQLQSGTVSDIDVVFGCAMPVPG